jgi:Protein of unknown function (DUF1501)
MNDQLERRVHVGPLMSRRQLLRVGAAGCMGLTLPRLFAAESSSGPSRVKSCILIFYYGGPSHLDTWDMKPNAPQEIRGQFKSIATTVPGLRVCEHLPFAAGIAHKLAVIRSMHHPMRNHNAAAVEALCGRTPLKGDLELLADDTLSFPCYGSALSYELGGQRPDLAHVALPHVMHNVVRLPGQSAGFLGSAYNPVQVESDPNSPDFHPGELELPAGMSYQRLNNRESLMRLIDRQRASAAVWEGSGPMRASQQKAVRLIRSAAVRRAFDIAQEDPRTRDRYGRNTHGQSVLLARRLVEAGARFVTVNDRVHNGQDANWDSHQDVFGRLKDHLLPPADRAFSALIQDLEARGLLDSTLVVSLGEFGRTPQVNREAGRDHWPDCFSVVLAGGGVKGGSVYGSSDRIGAHPDSDPVTPGDLAATLFWRFGLDPASELRDSTGRPYRLAEGEPLRRLFTDGA